MEQSVNGEEMLQTLVLIWEKQPFTMLEFSLPHNKQKPKVW